jgi:hypothetical protein
MLPTFSTRLGWESRETSVMFQMASGLKACPDTQVSKNKRNWGHRKVCIYKYNF